MDHINLLKKKKKHTQATKFIEKINIVWDIFKMDYLFNSMDYLYAYYLLDI